MYLTNNSQSQNYTSAMGATRNGRSRFCPPNLPGYSTNNRIPKGKFGERRARKQCFMVQQGVTYEKTPMAESSLRKRELNLSRSSASFLNRSTNQWASLRSSASIGSFAVLDASKPSAEERFERKFGKVLKFSGYFKEAVNEAGGLSYGENHRVRKVNIFFYLEDDTMEITEVKTDNSGMVQGNFLKRHLAEKDRRTGENFTLDDLQVGREITVYSRTYYITGCNGSTKRYLEKTRGDVIEEHDAPTDLFTKSRAEQQTRDTGNDHTVSRNKKMHEMKKFMEANMGSTVNLKGLNGFLKHGRDVLRFAAIWDDRSSLYGDRLHYYVHFFLSDNTVEILERHEPNNGRDPFPVLMNRQKCKKSWRVDDATGRADEEPESQYYAWSEFGVGRRITINGRDMELVDADEFTREWFVKQGPEHQLCGAIDVDARDRAARGAAPTAEEIVAAKLAIPAPFNGWGSETDSLENTRSLVPKPPKTPFDLFGQQLESHILRFSAIFDPKTVVEQDAGRKFIIDFFTHDNTLQIVEPAQRNSGVVGGKFLRKAKYEDTARKALITPADLAVGEFVTVNHVRFLITAVDAKTEKLLSTQSSFNQSLSLDAF